LTTGHGTAGGDSCVFRILAIATVVLALSKVASTSLASVSNPEWALMVEGSD
jgi:hypothetical protein